MFSRMRATKRFDQRFETEVIAKVERLLHPTATPKLEPYTFDWPDDDVYVSLISFKEGQVFVESSRARIGRLLGKRFGKSRCTQHDREPGICLIEVR